MESSILSEVDDTSILRTGLSTCYWCPLDWLRPLGSCPRAAGWSAATLCIGTFRPIVALQQHRSEWGWTGHRKHCGSARLTQSQHEQAAFAAMHGPDLLVGMDTFEHGILSLNRHREVATNTQDARRVRSVAVEQRSLPSWARAACTL